MSTDNMARFLMCDLAVEEAEAQDREVRQPIEENWIIAHAAEIKAAVLSLVNHWVDKNMPGCSGRIRRGFETWSHTIGGIIECAGLGDLFEARPDDAISGSPDDAHLRQLVHALVNELDLEQRQKGFHFNDIVQLCHRLGILDRFLDGKEDKNEATGEVTLTLSSAARSKFGNFLKRYAPEKRGRIWHFPPEEHYPYARTCRLTCTGHDRTREYVASLEVTPQNEIKGRLHEDNSSWDELVPFLERQGFPTVFESLSNLDCATLAANWEQHVRPHLQAYREADLATATAQPTTQPF
jgi:hypothetical protein